LAEVTGVHDLHIWGLSTTETALTAHLVVTEDCDRDRLLRQTENDLHGLHGIEHSTLQIESPGCEGCKCRLQATG
jgi:cobalt-zinc-cadmium efflux system protein